MDYLWTAGLLRPKSGGIAPLAPDAIANLEFWLKADTGLWQLSNKTNAATADGDRVGAWADSGGKGYDFINATADNRGTLDTDALNGHSVIGFDGVSDFLGRAGNATGVGPWAATVGDGWEVPGGFTNTGLCYDPAGAGSFWIGDFTNSKIINTTLAGAYIGEIAISAPPQGVALDTSDDTLWWADWVTNSIIHIQKDGTVLADPIVLTYDPNGLAYEPASDSLWVCEEATKKVNRYLCADGSLQETITLPTSETGNTDGVYYDAIDDVLWILTDNADRLVKVRAADGLVLGNWKIPGANSPECPAIVGGTLYFCNDAEFHEGIADGNRVRTITIADLPVSSITLAIVVSIDTAAALSCLFAVGRPEDSVGFAIYYVNTTTLRTIVRDGTTQISQDRAIGSGYRILIVTVDKANNQITVRDNGAQTGAIIDISTVLGQIISSRASSLAGQQNGPLVRWADVNAAEVCIFSRALTLTQIQGLERYLATKFGISI